MKKKNGKWRVSIDFNNLNEDCPKDSFPLLRINQLVETTTRHELLNFMDAYSGYNKIKMYPPDEDKTAFTTGLGIFCYKLIPFGLKNAEATFQRMVDRLLKDLIRQTMEVYVDNMLMKKYPML